MLMNYVGKYEVGYHALGTTRPIPCLHFHRRRVSDSPEVCQMDYHTIAPHLSLSSMMYNDRQLLITPLGIFKMFLMLGSSCSLFLFYDNAMINAMYLIIFYNIVIKMFCGNSQVIRDMYIRYMPVCNFFYYYCMSRDIQIMLILKLDPCWISSLFINFAESTLTSNDIQHRVMSYFQPTNHQHT